MQREIKIIYEDDDILVIDKPDGILSEDAPGDRNSVPSLLTSHVAPVTRLDRNVSGVMLLAKNRRAAAFLSAEVSDHARFHKEYRAIVAGELAVKAGELHDLLFKDSSKNKTFVVKRMRRGVKEASLSYETLGSIASDIGMISLLAVRLHTGRTHQIRVQFASRRHPLLGDGKYGGASSYPLALHAHRISFIHPNGQRVSFDSPLPHQSPWTLFPEEKR